jgi:hypothetical protein
LDNKNKELDKLKNESQKFEFFNKQMLNLKQTVNEQKNVNNLSEKCELKSDINIQTDNLFS